MSLSFSDLARHLFRRSATKPVACPNRARLSLTPLEDRTVPTVTVTVSALTSSIGEGDSATVGFRISRSNTDDLLLQGSAGWTGTATPGSGGDFTASYASLMSPAVLFWSMGGSQTYVDVYITPVNDSTSEPTETMILTLGTDPSYTVGSASSATVDLLDNDAQVVSVEAVSDAAEAGDEGLQGI